MTALRVRARAGGGRSVGDASVHPEGEAPIVHLRLLAGLALSNGKEWGGWLAIVAIGLEIAVLYALTAGWRNAKATLRGL